MTEANPDEQDDRLPDGGGGWRPADEQDGRLGDEPGRRPGDNQGGRVPADEQESRPGDQQDGRPGDEQVGRRLADTVARLRRSMRRAARASAPDNPLSVAQLELMARLAERPGSRPGELARALRIAPNTVTTLVNALVRARMVRRDDDPADRRTVHLTLTAHGRATLARWERTNEAILSRAQARLDADQRAALRTALPALARLIEEIDSDTGDGRAARR
ncbi:MarR family winged helix-turn-helix transcriptional regulator [Actinocatenispora sera]|uniref:MarR family winged helix-turn-helix transcriptional regulator n=1 Tax=Actinocatenispora sera TaxID=390989 RepID=UPI0033E1D146